MHQLQPSFEGAASEPVRRLGRAIVVTYLIYEGRVESEGTKDFLINDPISRQLYLGERFKM
jgi:ABC-type lipopolysaccharide export system ATPase subunit